MTTIANGPNSGSTPQRELDTRILLVDDDPLLLECLRRVHGASFDIVTAQGGRAALRILELDGPFAVVVVDRQMPEMDGVKVLEQLRRICPDTVRIMLTGQADIDSAIQAVNRGEVFRFLTKPCAREDFEGALEAAIRQYRLQRAERDLLEKTLRGSVQVLVDVLSLVAPTAFARANRVHRYVARIARRMQLLNAWQYETAALLSQIGYVALPRRTIEHLEAGATLSPAEADMVRRHPLLARDVLCAIPRLEKVAAILAVAAGVEDADEWSITSDVRIGARVLAVALEFDRLVSAGIAQSAAIADLESRNTSFDRDVVATLNEVLPELNQPGVRTIEVEALEDGWFLAHDLVSLAGDLVARRGQEITHHLRARIENHVALGELPEDLLLRVAENPELREPSLTVAPD